MDDIVKRLKDLVDKTDLNLVLDDAAVEIYNLRADLAELKSNHEWQPIETALPAIPVIVSDGHVMGLARLQCVGPFQQNLAWCLVGVYLERITFDPTHWHPLPELPTRGNKKHMYNQPMTKSEFIDHISKGHP